MKKEITISVNAEELFDMRWMCVKEVQETIDELDDAKHEGLTDLSNRLREKANRLNDLHDELCRLYSEKFED